MLFHREVYWEDWFDEASLELVKNLGGFTFHMHEHFSNTTEARYDYTSKGVVDAILNIRKQQCKPFEVELINNNITKAVYRIEYDNTRDISIVFRRGFVITAWLNNKTDKHSTLDSSKYTRRV